MIKKHAEGDLSRLNSELENIVKERTKALRREVQERKLAETLLRESEEKYRQIFENANDGILLSIDGIIEFINPKLYEITGFLPRESIARPFTDFVHPDHRNLVLQSHIDRLQGKDVPERYDIKAFNKKGEEKWFELKSALITWEQKPAILTFVTDITERKETEAQLAELNQHLEERVKKELRKTKMQQQLLIQKSKLESLGELAAGIAHEINQPLGAISLSLDNILLKLNEGLALPEYIQSKIKQSFEDIERIRNIIDHIRAFSRDQDAVGHKKVDVNKVILNALSMVKQQYQHHQVEFILDLENSRPFVSGNHYKLEQVILNLLSNAKYAVEEKQKIQASKKQIHIRTSLKQNDLIIEIKDNGIGIPKKQISKIFDPFYTTKPLETGTGLGLSISYGIIKDMKGDIRVRSVENEFTKMAIILPQYGVKKS